jgi:hypothetical protein
MYDPGHLDLRVDVDVVCLLPFAETFAVGTNGGILGEGCTTIRRNFPAWVLAEISLGLRWFNALVKSAATRFGYVRESEVFDVGH